jgi:hypothetical protein
MKRLGLLPVLLLAACRGGGTTWLGAQIVADGAAGSSPDGETTTPPANFFMRYEAESVLNTLTFPVEGVKSTAKCPEGGVTEGANCASGGQYIDQILGRSPCQPATSRTSLNGCQNMGGGVLFNEVTVPVDGDYDVTWWYHCGEDPGNPGQANVFGDKRCGGLDYGTGPDSGCRPHLIDVNGVPMSSTVAGKPAPYFHFPCYSGPWTLLHGATTVLPLNAGTNSIYIHAPGASMLDSADMDALDVQAAGYGEATPPLWPKHVTPVELPD